MSDSEQYHRLRHMRNVAVPTILVSVVCIGVGVGTIIQSKPHYHFPICLGGGILTGFATLLAAYWNIKLYRMYVSSGGDPDDHCWRIQMIFIGTLLLLALIYGLGMSGIWCMVEITDSIKAPKLFPSEENSERAECGKKTLGYGIATFVLIFLLWILKGIAYCYCYLPRTTQPQSTTFGQIETDNRNIYSPTNYSSYNSHRTPTAPSQDRVPTAPTHNSLDPFQRLDLNDADDRRGHSAPPPQYVDVCDSSPSQPSPSDEPPPPSYEDVLEHGAYRVFHV